MTTLVQSNTQHMTLLLHEGRGQQDNWWSTSAVRTVVTQNRCKIHRYRISHQLVLGEVTCNSCVLTCRGCYRLRYFFNLLLMLCEFAFTSSHIEHSPLSVFHAFVTYMCMSHNWSNPASSQSTPWPSPVSHVTDPPADGRTHLHLLLSLSHRESHWESPGSIHWGWIGRNVSGSCCRRVTRGRAATLELTTRLKPSSIVFKCIKPESFYIFRVCSVTQKQSHRYWLDLHMWSIYVFDILLQSVLSSSAFGGITVTTTNTERSVFTSNYNSLIRLISVTASPGIAG